MRFFIRYGAELSVCIDLDSEFVAQFDELGEVLVMSRLHRKPVAL